MFKFNNLITMKGFTMDTTNKNKKDITKLSLKVALEMLLKKDKEVRQLKADKLVTDFTIKMINELVEEKEKEIIRLHKILEKNNIVF